MIHSVAISQPLFPATLVDAQWTHKQSSHGGKEEGFAWAQQYGFPLIKADLATVTSDCPICQQQRPTLSPQFSTTPKGDEPATW